MAKFKGNNSITSAKTLFYERLDYELNATSEEVGRDFLGIEDLNFIEMNYYGRVDTNLNSVIPDVKFIKQLKYPYNAEYRFAALDFVTDAFYDLTKKFMEACIVNSIPANNAYLSKITAKSGYVDPVNGYREYINNMMQIYTNEYIIGNRHGLKVMNLKSFLDNLLPFFERMTDQYPMTFTAWHRSTNSNPFSSGLFLDLGGYGKDVDELKEERFLNNPAFEFYVNACVQHGFMVSHKNPSVICADLKSPAMLKYMLPYALRVPQDVFQRKFKTTHSMDIDEMARAIYTAYNDFVDLRGYERETTYCERSNKALVKLKTRDNINLDSFNKIFNNNYIIILYTKLRNIEESKVFGDPDIRRIIRQAKFFEKKFDINRAIRYINEQFRSTFKSKPGGVNWLKRWMTKREEERRLED